MKYGSIVCTILFVLSVILTVVQVWFSPFSSEIFWKLLFTLGAFFVAALAITLVMREYFSERELKKKGYLD